METVENHVVGNHVIENQTEPQRSRPNEIVGEVISCKMQKTITVLVYRSVRHKKYGKIMRRTSIFKAHDESNSAKQGDKVLLYETRPLSKTKRWKLAKILERADQLEGADV